MEGLVGVRAGGTRWLVVPANLGYGPDGPEGVPPDAVLVFRLVVNGIEAAQP
jgi:FKBP-type peptidyl-prolyl cis-trans isomerase